MASNLLRSLARRSNQIIATTTNPIPNYRGFSSSVSTPIRATLFPGDGIGPEIAASVKMNGKNIMQSFLTWESLESVRQNKVGLKWPMATAIGKGHRSLNLTLRKELNLYANVRPCTSLPGYKTRYDDVNIITIRENTEGEYSGLEHQVVRGVVESLKIITRQASLTVAIQVSLCKDSREKESVCNTQSQHYAENGWSFSQGFLSQCCREVAKKYPEITYEEVVIDNCCMMLKALGVDDIVGATIVKPLEQLFLLGALTDECKLSYPVGNQMARLHLDPIYCKAQCPSVDLPTNSITMHRCNNGKKRMAVRIIHLLTDQIANEVIVHAICMPCEWNSYWFRWSCETAWCSYLFSA
ncbi:hypothetical protein ACFE04_007682 [Oxalis oulophora]